VVYFLAKHNIKIPPVGDAAKLEFTELIVTNIRNTDQILVELTISQI
jgi:hypothetical protein